MSLDTAVDLHQTYYLMGRPSSSLLFPLLTIVGLSVVYLLAALQQALKPDVPELFEEGAKLLCSFAIAQLSFVIARNADRKEQQRKAGRNEALLKRATQLRKADLETIARAQRSLDGTVGMTLMGEAHDQHQRVQTAAASIAATSDIVTDYVVNVAEEQPFAQAWAALRVSASAYTLGTGDLGEMQSAANHVLGYLDDDYRA